jgi:hypothetical protein
MKFEMAEDIENALPSSSANALATSPGNGRRLFASISRLSAPETESFGGLRQVGRWVGSRPTPPDSGVGVADGRWRPWRHRRSRRHCGGHHGGARVGQAIGPRPSATVAAPTPSRPPTAPTPLTPTVAPTAPTTPAPPPLVATPVAAAVATGTPPPRAATALGRPHNCCTGSESAFLSTCWRWPWAPRSVVRSVGRDGHQCQWQRSSTPPRRSARRRGS